jgi:hypothetical protein
VNPFSISRPHHQWRIGRALSQHETLALVLFPTLEQSCDDLLVSARPALMAEQTEPGNLAHPPEGKRKDRSGVESSKG